MLWTGVNKLTTFRKKTIEKSRRTDGLKRWLIGNAGNSGGITSGFVIITRWIILEWVEGTQTDSITKRIGITTKIDQTQLRLALWDHSSKPSIILELGHRVEGVGRLGLLGRNWGEPKEWILICRPLAHTEWIPAVIATTDVDMEPQKLLNLYGGRVEIKSLFQDAKTKTGFGKYQGRFLAAQQRFSQLVIVTQSINQIGAQKHPLEGIDLYEHCR